MNSLYEPMKLGALDLSHRIVMAPMSRYRCDERMAPTALVAEYYSQRATPGGLIIAEATHINPEGTPIWNIYGAYREHGGESPGIWTEHQTEAYRRVVDAVHAKGAAMSCQLQHCGRVAQDGMKNHLLVAGTDLPIGPVSSSATPMRATNEEANAYNWDETALPPRALELVEIQRVVDDYTKAAENAMRAGFDFVEIHAGHGYLIDQFLCDSVNRRTDMYGGSIENRCRLLFEVVEATLSVTGPGRVGVRLSPTFEGHIRYFDVRDSDPASLYGAAIEGLNEFALAYLLLTEPRAGGLGTSPSDDSAFSAPLSSARFREKYAGSLIGAGGFTPTTAAKAVEEGRYDLIAFGRWFLSNPDFVERIRKGSHLNVYDRPSFYGGDHDGYTDYPSEDGSVGTPDKYRLMAQNEIGTSLKK